MENNDISIPQNISGLSFDCPASSKGNISSNKATTINNVKFIGKDFQIETGLGISWVANSHYAYKMQQYNLKTNTNYNETIAGSCNANIFCSICFLVEGQRLDPEEKLNENILQKCLFLSSKSLRKTLFKDLLFKDQTEYFNILEAKEDINKTLRTDNSSSGYNISNDFLLYKEILTSNKIGSYFKAKSLYDIFTQETHSKRTDCIGASEYETILHNQITNNFKVSLALDFNLSYTTAYENSLNDNVEDPSLLAFNDWLINQNRLANLPLPISSHIQNNIIKQTSNNNLYSCERLSKLRDKTLKLFNTVNVIYDKKEVLKPLTFYRHNTDEIEVVTTETKASQELIQNIALTSSYTPKKDYYNLFLLVLWNITRTTSGELSNDNFTFVLKQVAKAIQEPFTKLKPSERGYTMFEGIQNSGKSLFLSLLQVLLGYSSAIKCNNSTVKGIYQASMNVDPYVFKKARFVILEEDIEMSLKMKELLKKFSFEDQITFSQKYKPTVTIDVNYTCFMAYNKPNSSVKGDIFLEEGGNRRFFYCTSSVNLGQYLSENNYSLKDIEDMMSEKNRKDVISSIISGLLAIEDTNYNYITADNTSVDKQERVKNAIHTTEGYMRELLQEMESDPDNFVKLETKHNKDLPLGYERNYNKEEDKYYSLIPLSFFNKHIWNDRIPPFTKRKFAEPVGKMIEEMGLENVKIVNKKNNYYFKLHHTPNYNTTLEVDI